MKKTLVFIMAVCLLTSVSLASFTACNSSEPTTSEPATTVATTPTTVAIVEAELSSMLTSEEITKAVGLPMGEPAVSGQGSMLTCIGNGNKAMLSVMLSEKPIEIFDQMLQAYPDAIPCPNLGETAWYSPVYCQLLSYAKGHMITVELTGTEDGDMEMQMLRCRQLTALLIEQL
ncbi:MAG: hypothetical protein IJD01_05105 [Clostridia bacterium]|nr:hypothetical protein [Clostridia bacterium]